MARAAGREAVHRREEGVLGDGSGEGILLCGGWCERDRVRMVCLHNVMG